MGNSPLAPCLPVVPAGRDCQSPLLVLAAGRYRPSQPPTAAGRKAAFVGKAPSSSWQHAPTRATLVSPEEGSLGKCHLRKTAQERSPKEDHRKRRSANIPKKPHAASLDCLAPRNQASIAIRRTPSAEQDEPGKDRPHPMKQPHTTSDPFGAAETLRSAAGEHRIYRLEALERAGLCQLDEWPYSLRILLEQALRHASGAHASGAHANASTSPAISVADVERLASRRAGQPPAGEVPFMVGRVLMQDFTGVPAVVDLAALRSAMVRLGGDPKRINPQIPTELVIDHSVQVDHFGSDLALAANEKIEFERNAERYRFLRWGQQAFDHFTVVPPSTGIVHQVNLEYLARVVMTAAPTPASGGLPLAYPDSVVGTDSHTTMINGLGVLGWGVGGIEAEASMLGQPYAMLCPAVVGVRLSGSLAPAVTATDLVLHITELLRAHGVVGKFVEFYGPALANLSLPDRSTLANMAPEYGATTGFFPVDERTLDYLRLTGREPAHIALVEAYLRRQGLFYRQDAPEPQYDERLQVNLNDVHPCVAGPKRPQDRVLLGGLPGEFAKNLIAPLSERGFALSPAETEQQVSIDSNGESDDESDGEKHALKHGSVVLAAITSCTNTSNPSVLIGAGLLARKARQRGLSVPSYVKTSLAPGSRVVTDYLQRSGLLTDLEALGFHVVGYGCTTCIGNSGPLPPNVAQALEGNELVVAGVLSGNRNFEGRINPQIRANYLASPPLVIAFALAGRVDIDLTGEPLGHDAQGQPVHLHDLWPTPEEIATVQRQCLDSQLFRTRYGSVLEDNQRWNAIEVAQESLYPWDAQSTYIQEPPFFQKITPTPPPLEDLNRARVLAWLGDSVTTDHISPAGSIAPGSAAAVYLREQGVTPAEFNSFGSRRGNDRVMTRGTFGNIRLRNALSLGREGSWTTHFPSGETLSIYEAAMRYRQSGTPLLIVGGKEYGSGSSRDWAAKGTALLGVKAVIAESFERIHRANLVGMGVLPLVFAEEGKNLGDYGLDGSETFQIEGLAGDLKPGQSLTLRATRGENGSVAGGSIDVPLKARLDTEVDVRYYRQGGILPTVLRQLLAA